MNLIAMALCWWEINNGKCRLILMNHQTKFDVICDPPREKVPLGAKNFWVYCTLLQTWQYWPDWWRFHSFASFRCLVTVLQSQGTLKLIIGEKRPWMIELIFRLPPCHVNEMTFASLLCVFLAVLLGCFYSQELKTRNWCNYNCVSCVVSWVARARKSHLVHLRSWAVLRSPWTKMARQSRSFYLRNYKE